MNQIPSCVRCSRVEIVKIGVMEKCCDEENVDHFENRELEEEARKNEIEDCGTIQSRAKPQRILRCSKKQCCVKGCEKTHFWQKKWKICTKCNKNFCPTHAYLLHHHKC